MSLLLKRIYPSAEDFDGNIASLHKALMPAKVSGDKEGGQSERFIAMMDYGVTIYLPGEEPDPYTSLVDSTPYVARFGHQIKKEDDSDPILEIADAEGDESHADHARRILKIVLRSLIRRLKAGGRIEILPGRYWQLLKNKALAAELCTDVDEGALMLEERTGDATKALPDALYCLQRLDQHSYLADLMEVDSAAGALDEEEFDFGSPFSKDISLFDLHSAFGGGLESDDSDDDDDESWKPE